MAVTHNVSGSGTTTVSSISFFITIAAGSDRCAVLGASWRDQVTSTDPATLTTVTLATVPATFLQLQASLAGNVEHYYVLNPPTGSQQIQATFTADLGSPLVLCRMGCEVANGVDQPNPIGQKGGAAGDSTAPSVTLAGTITGSLVVDTMLMDAIVDTSFAADAGQTQRWSGLVGSAAQGRIRGTGSTEPSPDGAVTMSWTLGAAKKWGIAALELKAVGAGTQIRDPLLPQGVIPFLR